MSTVNGDDGLESGLWQRLEDLESAISEGVDEELVGQLRRFTIDAASLGVPDCEVRGFRLLGRAMGRIGEEPPAVSAALAEALRVRGASFAELVFARYEFALSLRQHDVNSAIDNLEGCVADFIELDEASMAAMALLEVGELLGSTGQREVALERFEAARAWARSIGDAKLVARARDRLAAAHWELGRLGEAEQQLREALAVWEARGDRQELAHAQYRLGWCIASDVRTEHRGEEALELLNTARGTARSANDMALVAACDEKAAWVLRERNDRHAAIGLLRSAATVFDSLALDAELQVVRVNLGKHLLETGAFEEGEALLRWVINASSSIPTYRAGAARFLARHLIRTNRAEEAVRILEAHEQDVDTDNRIEAPAYLLTQAAAFNALAAVQATREKAEAALARLDRTEMPDMHAEALEFLARCRDYDGDRQGAEALMGQAVALYLIAGEDDKAHRLARELIPPIPGTEPVAPKRDLPVGVYL